MSIQYSSQTCSQEQENLSQCDLLCLFNLFWFQISGIHRVCPPSVTRDSRLQRRDSYIYTIRMFNNIIHNVRWTLYPTFFRTTLHSSCWPVTCTGPVLRFIWRVGSCVCSHWYTAGTKQIPAQEVKGPRAEVRLVSESKDEAATKEQLF